MFVLSSGIVSSSHVSWLLFMPCQPHLGRGVVKSHTLAVPFLSLEIGGWVCFAQDFEVALLPCTVFSWWVVGGLNADVVSALPSPSGPLGTWTPVGGCGYELGWVA